jgi:hypothetical protein
MGKENKLTICSDWLHDKYDDEDDYGCRNTMNSLVEVG